MMKSIHAHNNNQSRLLTLRWTHTLKRPIRDTNDVATAKIKDNIASQLSTLQPELSLSCAFSKAKGHTSHLHLTNPLETQRYKT